MSLWIVWLVFIAIPWCAQADPTSARPALTDIGVRTLITDAQWCSDTLLSWRMADRPEFGFYDVETGAQQALVDPDLGNVTQYDCGATSLFAITAKELVKYRLSDREVAYRVPLEDFARAMRDENAAHRKALGLPVQPAACLVDLVTARDRDDLPSAVREDKDVCVIGNFYDFYEGDNPPYDEAYLEGRYYIAEPLKEGVALRLSSLDGPGSFVNIGQCPGQVPCLEGDMTLDLIAFNSEGYADKLLKRTTLSALVDPILKQVAYQGFWGVEIEQFTARQSIILLMHSAHTLLSCEVALNDATSECDTFAVGDADAGYSLAAVRGGAPTSAILDRTFGTKFALLFYSKGQLCLSAPELRKVCPLRDGEWSPTSPDTLDYGNFVLGKDGAMLRAIYGQVSTPQEGPVGALDVDRLYIINAPVPAQP